MRFLAVLFGIALLSSCASPPKTYHAPSNKKVIESQKVLDQRVAKARDTALKARKATQDAKANSKRLIALAKTVKDKLEALRALAPPELIKAVEDVQTAAVAQEREESYLRINTDFADEFNGQLETQLAAAEAARIETVRAQHEYQYDTDGIAREATKESKARYDAQAQLAHNKILRWLFSGTIGMIIILGVAALIAWKLGWKFIKL